MSSVIESSYKEAQHSDFFVNQAKFLQDLERILNSMPTGFFNQNLAIPYITSVFNTVRAMGTLSMKELAEKVAAAKEQREVDEQLYGPNLPEDSNSELLDSFKKLNEAINALSLLKFPTLMFPIDNALIEKFKNIIDKN